jgi:predicted amidophosphoribosyltransferase
MLLIFLIFALPILGILAGYLHRREKDQVRLLCPACGGDVKRDYLACPHCGTRLQSECPECGKPVRSLWRSCPHCGTPLGGDPR